MPDQVLNRALGRMAELHNRVDTNDPANSVLTIVVVNTTQTDTILKRVDSLADFLGDPLTDEVTNAGYGRRQLTDADITAFVPDDVNDRVDLDMPDQVWAAVAAGDAWTDLLVCYDRDSLGGTDANIEVCCQYDFEVTPDGSDITAEVNPAGYYRAE